MKRSFFSKAWYMLAAVLIIVALGLTALSYILRDLKYYTELSLKQLEQSTGYRVVIDDISVSLARGSGIQIHDLKITDTRNNTALFSCSRVHILTEVIPLARKHLVVSSIVLDTPHINAELLQDNRISRLINAAESRESAPDASVLYDFTVSLKKVYIRKGRIIMNGQTGFQRGKIDNVEIKLVRNRRSGTYAFSSSAYYAVSYDNGTRNAHGYLNCATDHLSISTLAGAALRADVDFTADISPGASFSPAGEPALTCEGRMNFAAGAGRITIADIDAAVQNTIQLSGYLGFSGLDNKTACIETDLRTDFFDITDIVDPLSHLSPLITPLDTYLGYIRNGTIKIEELTLKEDLCDIFRTAADSLKVVIELRDADVEPPSSAERHTLSSGRLELDEGRILGMLEAKLFERDIHIIRFEAPFPYLNRGLSCSIFSSVPAVSLHSALSSANDFLPDYISFVPTAGFITAETRLSHDSGFSFTADVDLRHLSYMVFSTIEKPLGLSNKLIVSGTIGADRSMHNTSFDLHIDDSLSVRGTIESIDELVVSAEYSADSFNLNSLRYSAIDHALRLDGRVTAHGFFKTAATPDEEPTVLGEFSFDRFMLQEHSAADPLLKVDLQGEIAWPSANIKHGSVAFGRTSFSFNGPVKTCIPPTGLFTVDVDLFDINNFIRSVETLMHVDSDADDSPKTKPSIFKQTDIAAEMRMKQVLFDDWLTDNSTAFYTFKNGIMLWDNVVLNAGGGSVHGSVYYDYRVMADRLLRLTAKKSDVDILWGIPSLADDKTITGTLNLQGVFESRFGRKADIGKNMTGSFHAEVTDGKISKFTVLSKILSMMSIRRILQFRAPDLMSRGMQFTSIIGDFTMEHFLMNTKNLKMVSSPMNLSAAGSINIDTSDLDFVVAVQPLQMISRIMGSIPLAGTLLTGKDKSLTVGYFSVKGPVEDASVSPLPLTSVKNIFIKLFRSITDIPRDFLFFKKDNSTGESQ